MALLLTDQDFRGQILRELELAGHDILLPFDLGWTHVKVDDAKVLERAAAEQRILLTHNGWDFVKLHRQSSKHSGIIVCSQHPDWRILARNLQQALTAIKSMDGQLIRVNFSGHYVI